MVGPWSWLPGRKEDAVKHLGSKDAEAPAPPRLADISREAAEWRRQRAVAEPSEEEAMEEALEAQREAPVEQPLAQ